ncbi:MAG: ATP-binding protein [Candidatus Omnitrophota bacterium]
MIEYRTLDIDGLWNKMDSRATDPQKLIGRRVINTIIERFQTDHVELIIGPRQSGKTTLIMLLIHELLSRGVTPQQILYINLDTIGQMEQFSRPILLVDQVDRLRRNRERIYLFIDEVQRLETPGQYLKGLYDLDKNIKIFATGSSSIELKSKIKEFLTGRKRESHLFPISFKEYVNYQHKIPDLRDSLPIDDKSIIQWKQNETIFGQYLKRTMEEMAIYGGYPAVLRTDDVGSRMDELAEIYRSYVRKDIVEFLRVEKPEVFTQLVKVLASQVGNMVNKSEISSLLGSNAVTISKYLSMLSETYIASYLPPYVSGKRAEVKSAHKCFFIDNGIRNFSVRQFGDLTNRPDKGALIENLIFTELAKDDFLLNADMFYWRSKSGAEMDFVLQTSNGIIPIEIKSGSARPGLLSRSFHAFLDHFSPQFALFLNKDLFHIEMVNQTRVVYIPNHWFLLFGSDLVHSGKV